MLKVTDKSFKDQAREKKDKSAGRECGKTGRELQMTTEELQERNSKVSVNAADVAQVTPETTDTGS